MANWAMTTFSTADKDIVELIKNGLTLDFDYNEETGTGCCSLKWSFAALDWDKIEAVAKEHKSNLHMIARDLYGCNEQEIKFKNGVMTLFEERAVEPEWHFVDEDETCSDEDCEKSESDDDSTSWLDEI
jgi:hypothetical protein